jgi:hypothetical protein
MHIAPDDFAVHMMHGVEQVMMVAPVNADENEAKQVTDKRVAQH